MMVYVEFEVPYDAGLVGEIVREICWKDAAGAGRAYRNFVKRGLPIASDGLSVSRCCETMTIRFRGDSDIAQRLELYFSGGDE